MQTIERTFAVLRAIAEGDESVGVSEVARRAGLAKSTTSRILASLDELGMIDRLDDRYVIGQGLASLTDGARPGVALRDVARPYLVDLADEFGESVALAVEDGDEMVYVDTAVSEGMVQVRDWTGERFPLHTTSAGLVLLAAWTDDEVARYGQGDLEAFTDQTVTSADGLAARMRLVRDEGVAWTMGEFDEEINGIAAPIRDTNGTVVGAVNVSGPVYRFPADRPEPEIIEALVTACTQIGDRL